jgi:hypothetical protein
LPIYDGVVAFDDTHIPVIVGVEEDVIRLSADGTQIGEWTGEECTILYEGEGVFIINAEEESLRFLPRDPKSFAAAVNGGPMTPPTSTTGEDNPETTVPAVDSAVAPEPKKITKILFYLVAAMTAVLGLWALASLFL